MLPSSLKISRILSFKKHSVLPSVHHVTHHISSKHRPNIPHNGRKMFYIRSRRFFPKITSDQPKGLLGLMSRAEDNGKAIKVNTLLFSIFDYFLRSAMMLRFERTLPKKNRRNLRFFAPKTLGFFSQNGHTKGSFDAQATWCGKISRM